MGKKTRNQKIRHAEKRRQANIAKIQPCDPVCVDCGSMGQLVDGQRIYPHRPDLYAKKFYLCECGAYVGCHDGTEIALGRPAGKPTQRARNAAHAAFDPLWRRKIVKDGVSTKVARGAGYRWLAGQLGLEPAECHIGWMDEAMARRVVEVCAPFIRPRPRPEG